MVSIEERSSYLQQFEEGNDFCFLREFLLYKQVERPTQNSSIPHKILFALASNNITLIREILDDYSAKNPTSESQYIYKDLMVFLFICVTKKFELDQNWLLEFVEQRKSSEDEKNVITRTFQNLLKDNLESKDNYFEIVIVYKYLLGLTETKEDILNETYERLAKRPFPFYESEFLNLIALKAIDLIVLIKGVTTFRHYADLESFVGVFDKRVKQISKALYVLVLVITVAAQLFVAYKYFWGNEKEVELMGKILTVFNFIAIGAVGFGNRQVIGFFEKGIRRFFGRAYEI